MKAVWRLSGRSQHQRVQRKNAGHDAVLLYLWHGGVCGSAGEQAVLYGAFCILLAVLTNFQRAGFECVFTVLVLLAVQNPQGVGLAENQKFAQAVEFVGAGSFWLYLAHPLVLELLPNTAMGGAARGCASRGICRLPDGVLCAVYAFCAPV